MEEQYENQTDGISLRSGNADCAAGRLRHGGSGNTSTRNPAPETTAATLAAAEPTEPKTFFEEQGFTLWEGIPAEESADSFGGEGVSGKKLIPGGSEFRFEFTGDIVCTWYEQADVDLQVSIYSYPLEAFLAEDTQAHFTTANISNVLDSFYQADTAINGTMTKEEWLEAHQDYKILWCQCERDMKSADVLYNFQKEEGLLQSEYSWYARVWAEELSVMDCTDGSIYEAPGDALGIPLVFQVRDGADLRDAYAVWDLNSEWYEDSTRPDGYDYFKNIICSEAMIVFVPEDCDTIAFVLPLVSEYIHAEEYETLLNGGNDVEWKTMTYSEYTKGKDYYKYYFFADRME